jgi:hypothetical protein
MKNVVTAEPVVVVEVECKCMLAGRGDEANNGQEHRNPTANEQRETVAPLWLTLRRAIASGAPERRYPALQPVGEALPPDEFHVPQKIPPDGDGSCDVQLPGASAAAAHEVERAGHEYGKNDENHVEHGFPFVERRVVLLDLRGVSPPFPTPQG